MPANLTPSSAKLNLPAINGAIGADVLAEQLEPGYVTVLAGAMEMEEQGVAR